MTKARDIASAAPAPSTVSATEIGYLDGVSSAIQTQIDGKSGTSHNHDSTYVAKSLVDAKGDLLVGSANDTVSRLAVASTAGYVLTVDSAEATGLKWAAAGSSFVGCSVFNSTNLTIANDTETAVTFNSERFDTDSFHSTTTNTSRITIPTGKGGKYLFTAHFNMGTASTDSVRLNFRVNNVTKVFSSGFARPSAAWTGMYGSSILNLAAGDYVELFVWQKNGGNETLNGGEEYLGFDCVFLGA